VLGPALGGLLGHASLRVPVFFAGALTFANLIFAAVALPESHQPDDDEPLDWDKLAQPLLELPRQLVRNRMARIFLIAFLTTLAMAIFETTFALMVPLKYGYRAAGVGSLLAYAGLIQAITQGYLLGRAVKRIGELRLIRAGLLLFALGMAPMASFRSPGPLLILLAVLSLGYGFANPSITSLISRMAGNLQGELLGVNQSALALARILGPILAGFVYGISGSVVVYIAGGATGIIALLLATQVNPMKGEASR
jgi:predicted MFS family arabinose efflux permease